MNLKWAYRLGIWGVGWAILTLLLLAPSQKQCAANDLCWMLFSFANPPLLVVGPLMVELLAAFNLLPVIAAHAIPLTYSALLMRTLFTTIVIDGAAGFLLGMIIDRISAVSNGLGRHRSIESR